MPCLASLGFVLASTVLAAPAGQADAEKDFDAFSSEYEQARKEFLQHVEELQATGDEGEVEEYTAQWNPAEAFLDRAGEKAAEYAGTDGAVPFLLWIVRNDLAVEGAPDAVPPRTLEALTTLGKSHPEHASLLGAVAEAIYWAWEIGQPRTIATLEHLRGSTQSPRLRETCTLIGHRVRLSDPELAQDEVARIRAALVALAEGSEREGLKSDVEKLLFEVDHLRVGKVAPDIEAEDLFGERFRLSDYRGKVVMLDFWGDW